jgi:response regulator NasT
VITSRPPAELQSALDITLRRFAEYHNLEGAFDRRAIIERANGILMERHRMNEQQAFELLRQHSRDRGRKLIEIAQAVTDCNGLLPDNQPRNTTAPTDEASTPGADQRHLQ